MPLPFGDQTLAVGYRSAAQKARVISESWMEQYGYCLQCDSDRLRRTARNTPARDFECGSCSHPYELKSSALPFGGRIVDGAYSSMMQRVLKSSVPTFLLLHYSPEWKIVSLAAIHHSIITPTIIEPRKALSATAQRAGWVGCNILLSQIPPEGKIAIIHEGTALARGLVRERFAATERLTNLSLAERGWASSILLLLHKLKTPLFTINDAYSFENQLAAQYPSNKNVRPKIRQQLQVLRDKGLIQFLGTGTYRFTDVTSREQP